jgi:hypothetical protein
MATMANAADRAALLQRLDRLTPASQRLWGRMSSHQAVCHLTDSFKVAMGERDAQFASSLMSRTLIRFLALTSPVPWPKGVPTMKAVDQEFEGTRPLEFARDLSELRTLVERFSAPQRDFAFATHPAFGTLTEGEWLRWAWRHPDHHLRQFGL